MKKTFIFILLFCSAFVFAQNNQLTNSEILEKAVSFYNQGDYASCSSYLSQVPPDYKEGALVVKIYKAKLLLDENPTSTTAAVNAYNSLDPLEDAVKASKLEGLSDSYYSILMHCMAILGNDNDINDYFEQIEKPDETAIYLEAMYLLKNYRDCEQFLVQYLYKTGKRHFENKNLALLYAQVLAKQKKYMAAKEAYEGIKLADLDSKQKMNLAKIYYNLGEYDKAILLINQTQEVYVDYMMGLCYLNTSDWRSAVFSFDSYLANNGKKAPYSELASFYKAFGTYKAGNYKDSYTLFSEFADSTSELALARQAYELAAKSAVLLSDFSKASAQAEKLIQISFSEEDSHNAVLFCTDIYIEAKDYKKAEATLSPYINEKSDFGLTCLYNLAQIYEKSGNYIKADNIYNQIQERFSDKDLVEEACYKNAELFYSRNDYSTAAKRFSTYISKYPRGKYIEAAYYFSGECYLRCKEYNLSIMNSKNLVTKYPSSVYMYGANKNLFQAYYDSADYKNALKTANTLMNNYSSQAVQDGIPYEILVLNSIAEGNKKEIAEKQTEVEICGGVATKNGRLAAYELFALYVDNSENSRAYNLAKKLIENGNGKDSEEQFGLGQVTEYIADYSDEAEKPSLYIKAAEYYRTSGSDNGNAAAVLYKAVNAFLEIKKTGDARETAKVLKNLYPESRQAKNVDALF